MDEEGEIIDGPDPVRLDDVNGNLSVSTIVRAVGLTDPVTERWRIDSKTGQVTLLAPA